MEGCYILFDHRQEPELLVETVTIGDVAVRSYIIPIVQDRPLDKGV